jgi:hypothetical protein
MLGKRMYAAPEAGEIGGNKGLLVGLLYQNICSAGTRHVFGVWGKIGARGVNR